MNSDTYPQLFEEHPGVETIAYYQKGGFHPIHINDILQDRYHVVNKLGHGTYGTVWLVEDLKSGKCAALKILAAEISKDLANSDGTTDGREFVLELLDDFTVEGPIGTHQESWHPRGLSKRLVAQVTRGVAYLHSCGVVHGDTRYEPCAILVETIFLDLHAGNILFRIPGVEQMSYQDFAKYLGEPRERPLCRRDKKPVIFTPHQPKYVDPSSEMLDLLPLCLNAQELVQLKICDFGEAFLWDDKSLKAKLHTPAVYAAPEIPFHDYVGPATDI
ncbi:kinase-like domain-containing protein [Collybia nuda]|uniref:non-specific serine/threonine protein kinase n=1 Tax=Collybia nuda TaxID=64659 RepID=A0A9P5Y8H3_9AGAR|nr:kinase-like domain-containing protein [Collybia nuda]